MFRAHRNALVLATAFCFVFTAFSVAQNSQTSNLGSSGTIGLSILYGVFTISNSFSAWVVRALGVRRTLVFGALTYTLYVVANIQVVPALLFLSSGLLGLGAAMLWTGQGMYISNCATLHEYQNDLPGASTTGSFNGTFWSVFQLSQFSGNLLAALLYQFDVPSWIVFVCMSAIGGVGALSLLLLDDPSGELSRVEREDRSKRSQSQQQQHLSTSESATSDARSTLGIVTSGAGAGGLGDAGATALLANNHMSPRHLQHSSNDDDSSDDADGNRRATTSPFDQLGTILASLSLLRDERLLFLLVIIVYSGLSQGFIFGVFPPLVAEKNLRFYALAVFGAVDATSSMLMGKASDRVGRLPILAVGFMAHGVVLLYLMLVDTTDSPFATFALLATGLGIGDAAFNTQIYAVLGTFFEQQSEHAFANFKLFQSGSSTVSFVGQILITDVFTRSMVPLLCLIAGFGCLILCDQFFYPLSARASNAATAAATSVDPSSSPLQRGGGNRRRTAAAKLFGGGGGGAGEGDVEGEDDDDDEEKAAFIGGTKSVSAFSSV